MIQINALHFIRMLARLVDWDMLYFKEKIRRMTRKMSKRTGTMNTNMLHSTMSSR